MKNLSYLTCNVDTIIMFSFILPVMIFTLILMKLFILGEIYKDRHGCWPISYYFGERSGCQRMIDQKIENYKESFEKQINASSSSSFMDKIKKRVSSLKNMNLFVSEKIIQFHHFLLTFFFYFFKERI